MKDLTAEHISHRKTAVACGIQFHNTILAQCQMKDLINKYFADLIAVQEDPYDQIDLGEVWENLMCYIDKNSAASSGNTSGITPNNGETLSEKESIILTKQEFNFLMMVAEAQQNEHYNEEYSTELKKIAEQKNYNYTGKQPIYIDKKDNPVPSLFELLSNEFGEHSKDYEDICKFIANRKYGRETDKEQLKCHKFKNKTLMCATCNNFCTITGEKIPALKDRF